MMLYMEVDTYINVLCIISVSPYVAQYPILKFYYTLLPGRPVQWDLSSSGKPRCKECANKLS